MTNAEESTGQGSTAAFAFRVSMEDMAYVPKPQVPWRATIILGWIGVSIFALWGISRVFMQKWYMESIGYGSVFSTNFQTGLVLFIMWGLLFGAAAFVPTWMYTNNFHVRRVATHLALWIAIVGGAILSWSYHAFLLFLNGEKFGKSEPVFGADHGFYLFTLPAIWISYRAALYILLTAALFFLVARITRLSAKDGAWRKPECTMGKRILLIFNKASTRCSSCSASGGRSGLSCPATPLCMRRMRGRARES